MTNEARARLLLEAEYDGLGWHDAVARVMAGDPLPSEAAALRAIESALSLRAEVIEEWQPIETAPKDRPILSLNRYGVVAIIQWWPHAFLEVGSFRGAWDDGERDSDGDPDTFTEYHPAVWRPLPEPPAIRSLANQESGNG